MSIYRGGVQVLNDEQHKVVAPLIDRAARLGPYAWLAGFASGAAGLVVLGATDSLAFAVLVTIASGNMLGRLSVQANRERVVTLWLKELDK